MDLVAELSPPIATSARRFYPCGVHAARVNSKSVAGEEIRDLGPRLLMEVVAVRVLRFSTSIRLELLRAASGSTYRFFSASKFVESERNINRGLPRQESPADYAVK